MDGRRLIDSEDQFPEEFLCPIDTKLMTDPVITECGHTFNRDSITDWFAREARCPCCMKNLPSKILISNLALISAIDLWKESQTTLHAQNQEIHFLRKLVPDPSMQIGEEKHIQSLPIDRTIEEQTKIIRAIESAIREKERKIAAALVLRRTLRNRVIKSIGCTEQREPIDEVKESSLNIAVPGIANQVVNFRQQFQTLKQNYMAKKEELSRQIQVLAERISKNPPELIGDDIQQQNNLSQEIRQLTERYTRERKKLGRHTNSFLKDRVQPLLANNLPRLLRVDKWLRQTSEELTELYQREAKELERMVEYCKRRSISKPPAFGKTYPQIRPFGLPFFALGKFSALPKQQPLPSDAATPSPFSCDP